MLHSAGLIRSLAQPTTFTSWHVSFSLVTLWLARFFLRFSRSVQKKKQFTQFVNSNNCAAPNSLPKPVFGAIRHKLNLLLYSGGDLLDSVFATKFRQYGATHALLDKNKVPVVIHTTDPANLNTILSKSFNDWAPSKNRARTMYPLAQEGLLNSDGSYWHKNRKLILRHIGVKRAKDVQNLEPDVQLLFDAIGPAGSDGWTGVVDLLDLFHRLSLDTSTTFLLGTSANSQVGGIRDARMRAAMEEFGLVRGKRNSKLHYDEAYEIVRTFFSWRSKLGSKYWLADSRKYREACDTLNTFADDLIQRAINRSSSPSVENENDSRFGLIDSLVKEIGDPIHIRNLVMDLFIAGQNMSGTLAAWVFAQLEAHPDLWTRVRNEVLEKFGTEQEPAAAMTWDNLKSCTTMQHVIFETLRCYPLLAQISRNSTCDTVLPTGGGEDGTQPIAVPKGAAVTCNVYLMHRREEEWGADAWEFNPDRWIGRKFGPEYAPFGGGPRVCIGSQLTMTEISFLIARMMQRFSEMRSPEGQDNLEKGYRVVVAPKNGVKVRLRRAG